MAAGAVHSATPLEQLNLTHDRSEYLIYVTNLSAASITAAASARGSEEAELLTIDGRISNAYSVFVDGVLVGSGFNAAHSYGSESYEISLNLGSSRIRPDRPHQLAILSTSLGMHSHVTKRALDFKGIVGKVKLGSTDLTAGGWMHVPGLAGEQLGAGAGAATLAWGACGGGGGSGPLTWRKATFKLPENPQFSGGNKSTSVMLDIAGMSRGHFFLNGIDLGKYWSVTDGKEMTQRYYQLPTSLLLPAGVANVLVMADELGTTVSPPGVRVVLSTMT